jgi:hypothetical protein
MLIQIANPSTTLNDVYSLLWNECEKIGSFTFSTERHGHIVCHGTLNQKVSRVFAPILSSEGDAYMNAEILCMVDLLKKNGVEVSFTGEQVKEHKAKAGKTKINKNDLKNASSLRDCLRRLEDSGYDMVQLTDHLDGLRIDGRRVNKYDVVDFVFKDAIVPTMTDRKPLRSGAEWMRVKQLVEGRNLPDGYKSIDEFATFASKDEIDGL